MRCEDIQQIISECLDTGQPCATAVRQHVDGCPTCAAFERDCLELDTLLTAGRASAPRRQLRFPMWSVPILVAAAAAIALFLMLPIGAQKRPGPHGPTPAPLPHFDVVGGLAEAVHNATVAPVRNEVVALVADARSATHSLLSCLPSPDDFKPQR